MIAGKLWMRFTKEGGEPRRWVKNFRWHVRREQDGMCCWLEQALENLSRHPPVETRGRKKLVLPKEKRLSRLSVLRRRARVVQRLKLLMMLPTKQRDIDEVIRLGSQLEEMKEEIAPLGGVPPSWE